MTSSVTHIFVTAHPTEPQRGTLRCGELALPCVLGRSGINAVKREGDGATPTGCFPLRRLLYRPDRLEMPETALPVAAINRDDGWCDDPADTQYNRPVKMPYAARAEVMWRDDHLYDVVIVIGHNDNPVVPNAGSAIFMHVVAPDGKPTEGCIALQRDDLLAVLRSIGPETMIEIGKGV